MKISEMMLSGAVLLLALVSGSAQVLTSIYNFDKNTDDQNLNGGLLLSSNTLYAATAGSGGYLGSPRDLNRSGAVFKLRTDGTGFTNLYIFSPVTQYDRNSAWTNIDGANPPAELVLSGNRMYGTTEHGGFYGSGAIFAINADGTGFTNLHNFSATVYTGIASNVDGATPSSGLALSGNSLYGTTSAGGPFGGGTVFAIQTDGTGFTNLYSFNSEYGVNRGLKSSLIVSNETLYGTTTAGGSSGNGTVFALKTAGTGFTNLHSFTALVSGTNSDGIGPSAGLVLAGNTLYGTTAGVSSRNSTLFAVNTDGTGFTNLHNFNTASGARGSVNPNTRLVLSGSTLYGTTQLGGFKNNGAVFAINTDGTGFATLHSFTLRTANQSGTYTNADGALPGGNLVLSGSLLYGATAEGGANGFGTVFALDLAVAPPTIHVQFTATPTNGVPPLPVQFISPAVDEDGDSILSWSWDFGDGSSSTAQNPSHTYTNTGSFFPILTCLNNNGSTVIGSGPAIAVSYPSSILNGGFETRSFTNWTLSGQSQSVLTGSKYAHAGAYGAGLYSPQGGFLSQTLSTTLGSVYIVSFWLDYSSTLKTPNDFQVLWNGSVLLDKTNLTAIGWTNIQLMLTASTNISTLQFKFMNGSAYFGLDDVSVLPVAELRIAGIGLAGADLILNATGALSGRSYHAVTAATLTEPLSQWTSVATNVAGADGNLSITAPNTVHADIPQRFFLLQLQ